MAKQKECKKSSSRRSAGERKRARLDTITRKMANIDKMENEAIAAGRVLAECHRKAYTRLFDERAAILAGKINP